MKMSKNEERNVGQPSFFPSIAALILSEASNASLFKIVPLIAAVYW